SGDGGRRHLHFGRLVAVVGDGDAGPFEILLGVAAIGRAGQRLALDGHRAARRLAGEGGGSDQRPGVLLCRGPSLGVVAGGEVRGQRRDVDAGRRELGDERQHGGGVAQAAAVVAAPAVAVLAPAEVLDRGGEGRGGAGAVAVEGERGPELGLGEG